MASNNGDSLLSLCLSAAGRERILVSLSKNASLQELYDKARSVLDSSKVMELKHGFPPKVLQETTDTTLQNAGVQNKDRIIVNIMQEETKKKASPTKQGGARKKTFQRAAAKAASDSFGDVIRAQEDMMKQQQTFGRSNKRKPSSTSGGGSKRKRTTNKNTFHKLPGGRRLQDGASVPSPAAAARKKKSTTGTPMNNEEDVSVALLNALNGGGGGGGGQVGHVLRGAMKNAIANRYAASRAVSKVSAVQAKHYSIEETNDGKLSIQYSKGLEGRGMFDETVDCIPRDALQAVIKAIYSNQDQREMLRPTTLAQVSPRVFWSLIYLFQNKDCETVEECLSLLLPELDWSFQRKRSKTLSEKARENLRQEQQGDDDTNGESNVQAAQEAVQAVEDAMEQLSEYDASQRRDRAARAAMARHEEDNHVTIEPEETTPATATTTTWQLTTPTEEDDDELQECISTNMDNDDQVKRLIATLHSIDIHNWRQLANASVETISQATLIPEHQVEAWLDYAQAQSLEEVMVELCDGRVDVVQALRDEARTGTIKDLANWKKMPDLLYSSAPSLAGMQGVDVSHVRTWCLRAQAVLDEWEWTSWYATGVE